MVAKVSFGGDFVQRECDVTRPAVVDAAHSRWKKNPKLIICGRMIALVGLNASTMPCSN
jgi:hypothetical protein